MGGALLHALIKIDLLAGELVFALGEILRHLRAFTIALEAETYAVRILAQHQNVGLEVRFDLEFVSFVLSLPLIRIPVSEVISGMQIVAPGGLRPGSRDGGKHEKRSSDGNNGGGDRPGTYGKVRHQFLRYFL